MRYYNRPEPTEKPVWQDFTLLGRPAFISDRALTNGEWEAMWEMFDSLGVDAQLWDGNKTEIECHDDKSFVVLKLALMG